MKVGPLTSKVLIKIKQRTQFLAELLKALMTKIMSSANIKWLKLLERFLLKPGTKSRERALFRLTVRFWETRTKRRGGNRVPLTNASGTLNPRSVVAIKNKKEGSRGEARLNPSYPIIWKIHSLEGRNNNRPFNNIKCFFYIYFVNHPKVYTRISFKAKGYLMGCDYVIISATAREKPTLFRGNQNMYDILEIIS